MGKKIKTKTKTKVIEYFIYSIKKYIKYAGIFDHKRRKKLPLLLILSLLKPSREASFGQNLTNLIALRPICLIVYKPRKIWYKL